MKKILFLLLIIIVFIVLGCSKGETKNLNVISGNVIDNSKLQIIEVITEDEFIEEKEQEIFTVKLCHDTDNGIVRWVNGSVFGFYNNATRFEFNDICENFNYLTEFFCENENPMQRRFLCINGCEDNHCL